jgi:predicted lipid-binding transport protein (Tim44 family)
MGGEFQIFDILLLAAIAGFLLVRLWRVLGRRTGSEQPRDPMWNRPSVSPPPRPPGASAKVVPLPPRGPVIDAVASPVPASTPPVRIDIAALRAADPGFEEQHFLAGARAAFQIVVNSFAAGDEAALRPLLSDEVFRSFSQAIDARRAAHERLETNLIALKTAELTSAAVEGDSGLVTVRFVSDQTNVVRGQDGTVHEGDPEHVVEKTDLWTFARVLLSPDPNWILVTTHNT